jgi:hypothetical protein
MAQLRSFIGVDAPESLAMDTFLALTRNARVTFGLPLVSLLRATLAVLPGLCFNHLDFSHDYVLSGMTAVPSDLAHSAAFLQVLNQSNEQSQRFYLLQSIAFWCSELGVFLSSGKSTGAFMSLFVF